MLEKFFASQQRIRELEAERDALKEQNITLRQVVDQQKLEIRVDQRGWKRDHEITLRLKQELKAAQALSVEKGIAHANVEVTLRRLETRARECVMSQGEFLCDACEDVTLELRGESPKDRKP